MAYAETTDLSLSSQRLIELTDTEEDPGVQDDALLDRLLVESQAIVDSILASALTVPFADPVPQLITVITSWIWAYRIYRHREVMEIPKSIADDYAMALKMLEQIVAGELIVDPGDDGEAGNTLVGVPRVTSSEPRGWTHRKSRTCL